MHNISINHERQAHKMLDILTRAQSLFHEDVSKVEGKLRELVQSSRFLVIGGAGTIGQAVTKELFIRNPKKLDVIDLSENQLVELVRDLRSTHAQDRGIFRTFVMDIGSVEFTSFLDWDGEYDYVLNLAALKHVRSEKDPFTLMRLIHVNLIYVSESLETLSRRGIKKYFCVSTDKVTNPVNLMGASKNLMEQCLFSHSGPAEVSSARFANVAFSEGSLLQSFRFRMQKNQPICGPNDVSRYFILPQEAGELCLLSCLRGQNRDVYFSKASDKVNLVPLQEVAEKFILSQGFEPFLCESEDEARSKAFSMIKSKKWPCFFSPSDTAGEKLFEEFFDESETVDFNQYKDIGVIKKDLLESDLVSTFIQDIKKIRARGHWSKEELIESFKSVLPSLNHLNRSKSLDEKM